MVTSALNRIFWSYIINGPCFSLVYLLPKEDWSRGTVDWPTKIQTDNLALDTNKVNFYFMLGAIGKQYPQCIDVGYAIIFLGGFISVIVVNPPEKNMAKCTSVHSREKKGSKIGQNCRWIVVKSTDMPMFLMHRPTWKFSQPNIHKWPGF